jgi:hypothetical protein
MASSFNNVVVNQTTTIIQSRAFADLFSQALNALPANSKIDIEINIGAGVVTIESEAFRQMASLPNGITINSAAMTFNSQSVPTLGSNVMTGLPVRALTLPAQTTLQANALQGLNALQVLNASLLVNPLVTDALNLTRSAVTPLIMLMPSSPSATFSTNSVVIPQSASGSTTTLVFDGHVPSADELTQMFAYQPSAAPAPVQVSVNFANTSNVTNSTFQSLQTGLTITTATGAIAPVAVQFNQVQAAVQQGGAQILQNVGALTNVSQFAGDYFDYVIIAPKIQNAKALNQCVVTSLSANAKASNVSNVPIPSAITPATPPNTPAVDIKTYNVTALVPNMTINDTVFHIVDNYIDPSDIALPSVSTIAIFSKANATAVAGNFFPALVVNGTMTVVNGSVSITGPRDAGLNRICQGYNARPAAQGTANTADSLLNGVVGSTVSLYDRSQSPNINPIATITYPDATTFSVQFNAEVVGCMQDYRPPSMVADFTNLANAGNAAWTTFSNRVASLIANNNALENILNQIQAQGLPAGVTVTPAKPTPKSISAELTALSKSDFNTAFSSWGALDLKYTTDYDSHLTAMKTYVDDAVTATNNNNTFIIENNAFKQFQTVLNSPTSPWALVRADFVFTDAVLKVYKVYTEAVSGYINARFGLGSQTFKSCTTMVRVPNFEFLRNLSKINDQTFYFCAAFKGPIIIPSNVVSIGTSAFNNCIDVAGIDIQDAIALRTIGDSAFESCLKATGNLAFSSAIYSAQPSVERIGNRAFFGCAFLTGHIYFPPGLKSLGVSAFNGCNRLNGTIVFPSNPDFTTIPESAFANCTALTGISTNAGNGTSLLLNGVRIPNGLLLPANITQIGANAFLGCSNFAGALNLKQSPASAIVSIGNAAFSGCAAFTSLVLPSTPAYSTISAECFKGCSGITNLVLSGNVTQILASAFQGCTKIANLPKLDNVNTIGNSAFNACNGMVGALVLGGNLNVLGDRAFYDCLFLTSATFLGPPPSSLKASSLIFGVTAAANTPFYVNVFTENGWNSTDSASVTAILNIHTAFRNKNAANSRVQMAFIDFNTLVSPSTPRELTINNYQSFNVYENDAAAAGGNVPSPDTDKLWNDVYIPSTLAGESLSAAQLNVNQAPLLQSQLTTRITPKVDTVKTTAIDMSLSINAVLNAFDGSSVVVRQTNAAEAITLRKMASATDQSTTADWYGVFTDNNVDYLYYAAATASVPVRVTSSVVSIGARSFFVNADVAAAADFKAKYNHKVIRVGNDGAASVSSNVTAIGYGVADQPTAVQYTSVQPTTSRTGKGYSIVKSAVAGVPDKLYFDTLIAAAGTYFVSKMSVAGTLVVGDAATYNGVTIEVGEDGSVRRIVDSRNNRFVIVDVANAAANAAAITAVGQYGIIAGQQSGANTAYQLFRKTSATDAAAIAPASHYYIKSSDLPQLSNAIVLVHPNGGITVESVGASGAVSRVEDRINLLVAEQIPIFATTNESFQNASHINNVFARAHSVFSSSNQQLNASIMNHVVNGHTQLNNAMSSDIKNAIAGQVGAVGTSFNTEFSNLGLINAQFNDLLINAQTNDLRTKLSDYDAAITTFNEIFVGTSVGIPVNGLQLIQKNTLTNPLGMHAFRRNSTFNPTAFDSAVSADADNGLSNNLPYITTQMDSFLTQILKMQYNNKNATLSALFESVRSNVSFQESPTTNANPRALTYNNLSRQQRILFDHVANSISLWFNSDTPISLGLAGGQNSWGNSPTLQNAGTKLYSTSGSESDLLVWGKANIMAYFTRNGVDAYTQFFNNVQNISSFANIRVSISAYEAARANNANLDAAANEIAKTAYVAASKVNVLALDATNAITFDAGTSATDPLANGKLRFNQAVQTSATQLYVSLKDGQATPVDINFRGYADTIILNGGIAFAITAITQTANCYILNVAHVAGTGAANSITGPVAFVTYQTASIHTLGVPLAPENATIATMNTYVYEQYHNSVYNHPDGSPTNGIKAALTKAKNDLKSTQLALVQHCNAMNGKVSEIVQGSRALNAAEDTLMAHLHAVPSTGTTLVSNGALSLHRELQLTQFALQNSVNGNGNATPLVDSLPSHEQAWMQSRVAAFWADGSTNTTPALRLVAYTAADTAFVAARFARQTAAIASYVANAFPTQSIQSPVTTQFISEQAQKFSQTMPIFLGTSTKEDVARLISANAASYVLGRKLATSQLQGTALATALAQYQDTQQKEAAEKMTAANVAYGSALYQRYIALIDLAISRGYSDEVNATNAFQTLMQQWNVASSTRKLDVFAQIKPLLYNMVYTTDVTYVNSFPLKDGSNAIISWFGNAQNGFLNRMITDGLTFANQTLNGISYVTYELPIGFLVRINGADYNLSSANKVTINLVEQTLISASPQSMTTPPTLPSNTFGGIILFAATVAINPLNLAAAQTAAQSVASLTYDVTSIGYSSLPSSANLTALGFTQPANLQFSLTLVQNRLRYQFFADNKWHHGYQQSSDLANSWKKLSSAQDVVVFYPGNTNPADIPTNLDSTSQLITSLCDDATFVMIIEPVTGSTSVQSVSIYRYDVWGVTSGALIAVGTLTAVTNAAPNVAMYEVSGALQKNVNNPVGSAGVNLVGDLIITSKVKTIGIRAFSGLNRIKSLTFSDGGAISIGSNAFESCTALSAIHLGASVQSVGPSAFLKCTGATSLALPPASVSSSFATVNHWAFLGCNGIANDVQLPSNLVQINVQAFAGCTQLKCSRLNETLPVSVQKIGLGAFFNCKSLTGSLKFNNVNQNGKLISSIRVLGSAAFMGCTGLSGDVILPDNSDYVSVLPYTFASMDAPVFSIAANQLAPPVADLTPMALTGNVDFALNKVSTIEQSAFHRCNKLSTVNFTNVISAVGIQSFLGCTGLKQILLVPASVKSLGVEAFKGCSGLTGLNIASTMVSQIATEAWLSLGKSCFQDCTSLATSGSSNGIMIPNSVNTVGDSSFQGCTSIENVSIGSGLTKADSFGSLVFSGCTKLARVTLAFSYLSRNIAGQSVVKGAQLPIYNASFTGCTALGVPSDTPIGTIQIQSGATGWTPGRAAFFNNLTVVINNKNITFYLKEFNDLAKINVVDPSTEPLQQEAIPPTDAQATVHIKASDMRKVFLTSTDSFVAQTTAGDSVDQGQMFFVRPDYFPQYLNVANAQVVQGGIESYNAAIYEQLVKDDVMRYYAMTLFNSADWVTLFANDTEMLENMVASSGLMPIVPDGNYDEANSKNLYNTGVLYNIMNELNKVGHIKTSTAVDPTDKRVQSTNYPTTGTQWWGLPDTVLPEQGNIGKKLFGMINRNDPNRISSMVLNGSTPSELPFLPGDQFVFVFTLNENSVSLTPGLPPVVVRKRTYLVRMILTDDFVSGDASFSGHFNALYAPSPRNLNILPVSGAYAADHMYSNYNLQLAIKPSVLNQTASSVYSRVTQNAYEPIPMPVSLLPFTGWYYSYPYNSQTIRLNFTPPNLSDTNKYLFNDLRYLSAYVYFPENWSSVSVLPTPNNFPQWVLTFSNGATTITLKYKASYLPTAGAETVNFLGQTAPFDFTNTHVQLVCPFDTISQDTVLLGILAGKDAAGQAGSVNKVNSSHIYRQRNTALELVSGLRKTSSKVGPFTYPPIARGYQGINVTEPADQAANILLLKAVNTTYSLTSVHLEINMANNDGFVPSVVVKSVEVVAKDYEAYYLAPLDPN